VTDADLSPQGSRCHKIDRGDGLRQRSCGALLALQLSPGNQAADEENPPRELFHRDVVREVVGCVP
jgi:hypothetical protein